MWQAADAVVFKTAKEWYLKILGEETRDNIKKSDMSNWLCSVSGSHSSSSNEFITLEPIFKYPEKKRGKWAFWRGLHCLSTKQFLCWSTVAWMLWITVAGKNINSVTRFNLLLKITKSTSQKCLHLSSTQKVLCVCCQADYNSAQWQCEHCLQKFSGRKGIIPGKCLHIFNGLQFSVVRLTIRILADTVKWASVTVGEWTYSCHPTNMDFYSSHFGMGGLGKHRC